jgi:hypothetical protein
MFCGSLPKRSCHSFHASTYGMAMLSIRGRVVPSISGGPFGWRSGAPRGVRVQSFAV